jgi:Amt family ammonium transporter
VAHWVWGDGGWLKNLGALDFAGGTVVHINAGIAALAAALVVGKRQGYGNHATFIPHNLPMTILGAGLLWFGWFGFNAGSALAAGALASSAFTATHLATATATLSWVGAEWIVRGKPTTLGAASGAVAGLVAITPASGFVGPMSALAIGLIAGVGCYLMVVFVKAKFGYDDSLDAFGVHGAGGTIGALLTGVFALRAVNPVFHDGPVGLLDGNAGQVLNQLVGVAIAWTLAIIGSLVILKIVDVVLGLRVPEEHEIEGLDVTQHGEEGYNLEA